MHASVVTCGSEYFRAMLEHAMVESSSRSFEMHEMRPRVLKRVVEWLYSGELGEISDVGEGLALLEGSLFMRVARLEAQCIAWLCAHVEASNCVAVWAEANRLGCGAVAERAMSVMGQKLAIVAGEAEFLALPRMALLELVRSDWLAVQSERAVYEAVMGWMRHDVASRKVWLGDVLGAVRMSLLPLSYLACTVGADPLVTESFEAMRAVLEANHHSQSRGAERAAAERDGRFRKRKHASGGVLVVVGGMDDGGSNLKSAEMYDASAGQWQALPEMSMPRSGCAAVCVEGNVFVLGGYDGQSHVKSAEVYDTSAGQWRALPDMNVARRGCAVLCIEGNVYVVGGDDDGDSALKSAEVYDTSAGQWLALPDMSVARRGCAAVCVEGNVFVLGGLDDDAQDLKSAEMYDASAGQWRALPDMSVTRSGCAAVCVEGNVYVLGGRDGDSALKSAEVYDTFAGHWRVLPDMSVARHACSAACIEGNLCVVGGGDNDHAAVKSAEMYDISAGQWRALSQMSVARNGCAAVNIDGNVYVMGGLDGTTALATVECYDPVANEWRLLPSMSSARSYCAAVVGETGHG
jgi:N-acetylneuraminic acid mutarotase